jgi:MSHA biogenesis protein MshQ
VFTSSGTLAVPAGVTHLTGQIWGAGGGGGNVLGGGGAGAYESVLLTVTDGDVIHVTVGQAGAGGYQGTAGGDTTLSIDSYPVIASAGGGAGGTYPCSTVAGGTAGTPQSPALGIATRSGGGGDCGVSGDPGFVGHGGGPYQGYGGGGVVILSIDG